MYIVMGFNYLLVGIVILLILIILYFYFINRKKDIKTPKIKKEKQIHYIKENNNINEELKNKINKIEADNDKYFNFYDNKVLFRGTVINSYSEYNLYKLQFQPELGGSVFYNNNVKLNDYNLDVVNVPSGKYESYRVRPSIKKKRKN
jgi:hypothetical protein